MCLGDPDKQSGVIVAIDSSYTRDAGLASICSSEVMFQTLPQLLYLLYYSHDMLAKSTMRSNFLVYALIGKLYVVI